MSDCNEYISNFEIEMNLLHSTISTRQFSKKYKFPIYDKIQYGPVTKAESNFINNALMRVGVQKSTEKEFDKAADSNIKLNKNDNTHTIPI